jgi:dipeptidyl aminopeptidase/acylaminoacyl peptidase
MRARAEAWSRDGKLLLFHDRDLKTGTDLWVLPIGREPSLVLRTEFDEWGGQFSPDARFIAYASNESGRAEVYLQPFPGPGAKLPLFFIGLDDRLMARPSRSSSRRSGAGCKPRHDSNTSFRRMASGS